MYIFSAFSNKKFSTCECSSIIGSLCPLLRRHQDKPTNFLAHRLLQSAVWEKATCERGNGVSRCRRGRPIVARWNEGSYSLIAYPAAWPRRRGMDSRKNGYFRDNSQKGKMSPSHMYCCHETRSGLTHGQRQGGDHLPSKVRNS